MKITNNGSKIINFGKVYILPGATETVEDEFADNAITDMLVARGVIKVHKASKSAAAKAEAAASDGLTEQGNAAAESSDGAGAEPAAATGKKAAKEKKTAAAAAVESK